MITAETDPNNISNGSRPAEFDLWFEKQNDSAKALINCRISEMVMEISRKRKESNTYNSQLRNGVLAKREEYWRLKRILKRR